MKQNASCSQYGSCPTPTPTSIGTPPPVVTKGQLPHTGFEGVWIVFVIGVIALISGLIARRTR